MAEQIATGVQWVVDDSTGAITGYRRKINGVDTQFQASVSGAPAALRGSTLLVVGDSKSAVNSYSSAGIALSRSGGVVTATVANSVGYVGSTVRVRNAADYTYNGTFVLTGRTGASVTWSQAGVDGATTGASIAYAEFLSDRGPVAVAAARARCRMRLRVAGVSGEKAAQIAARVNAEDWTDVGAVVLDAGTNDLITIPTPAGAITDIIACIRAYAAKASSVGARLIVEIPAPPTAAYNAGQAATISAAFLAARAAIYAEQAAAGGAWTVADAWAALTDRGASPQMAYASPAVYIDGLHQSAIGADLQSWALKPQIESLPQSPDPYELVRDVGPFDAGAASAYSGITGTVSAALEMARGGATTGAASVVADVASAPGRTIYRQRCEWSFAANNDTVVIRRKVSASDHLAVAAGQRITARVRVSLVNCVAAQLKYWYVGILATPTGGSEALMSVYNYQSVTGPVSQDFDGLVTLPEFVVPSVGLTGMRLEIRAYGAGASASPLQMTVSEIEYLRRAA